MKRFLTTTAESFSLFATPNAALQTVQTTQKRMLRLMMSLKSRTTFKTKTLKLAEMHTRATWRSLRRHQPTIRLMMMMMRISAAGAELDQLLGQDPDSQVEEHQRFDMWIAMMMMTKMA